MNIYLCYISVYITVLMSYVLFTDIYNLFDSVCGNYIWYDYFNIKSYIRYYYWKNNYCQ